MVSSITPGTTGGLAQLGVDPRFTQQRHRTAANDSGAGAQTDQVQLSDAATWRAVAESVGVGLDQVRDTLSLGDEAKDFLAQVQALSGSDAPDAQEQLKETVQAFAARVNDAVKGGLVLAAGQDLSVQGEPGASPFNIAGLDLRPGGSVISIGEDAQVSPALGEAARTSRAALNSGLDRLSDAARSLTAHQGFLSAVSFNGVRTDLDADSARLLALQVKQGLSSLAGGVSGDPAGVLALFKS
ncbi:MAG: hypothetical protein ABUS57_06265 [Pseudomonadota bacterium]